jgi:hypothetical protein
MRGSAPGERRGGRQPGTPNRRTEALALAQAEAAEHVTQALGPDAFHGDAHALLMALYRDTAQPLDLRLQAAKAAIAYEKPRLAAVQVEQTPNEVTIKVIGGLPQFEEIARRVASEV